MWPTFILFGIRRLYIHVSNITIRAIALVEHLVITRWYSPNSRGHAPILAIPAHLRVEGTTFGQVVLSPSPMTSKISGGHRPNFHMLKTYHAYLDRVSRPHSTILKGKWYYVLLQRSRLEITSVDANLGFLLTLGDLTNVRFSAPRALAYIVDYHNFILFVFNLLIWWKLLVCYNFLPKTYH